MKFDLFSNLRPAGDALAAASWVKFTPLNGETDCSTCVTQNIKEKLQNVFQVFLQHSGQTCQLSTVDLSFLRGVKLFDAITFELEW